MGGYTTKIGDVYYAQLAVPAECRSALGGKKLFRKSLGTKDQREATLLAMPEVLRWRQMIDAARGQSDPRLEAAIAALAEAGYVARHPSIPESMDPDPVTGEATLATTRERLTEFARFARDLECDAASRREAIIATKMIEAGLPPESASTVAEAAVMAERNGKFEVIDGVIAALTDAPSPEATKVDARSETLADVVDLWKRERNPSRDARYSADFALRVFGELHGEVPLESVTRKHMAELMQALKDYPKNIPNDDRKLPVRELIGKYRGKAEHRPDLGTAAKKFNLIDAALEYSLAAGLIETNPAHGLKVDTGDAKKAKPKARLPFTDDDVKRLFNDLDGRDADFRWLALLGLTTGARLNEIAQLRVADVIEEDGHICINIHCEPDEHGPRSAKNKSSIRKVPLRHEIAEDFERFARAKGKGIIFTDYQTKEGTSAKASKRVMTWVRKHIADRRKVFHSFRHYLEDLCRNAGIPKDLRYRITGHTDSDVGESYGLGFRISAVSEAVERLRFPIQLRG